MSERGPLDELAELGQKFHAAMEEVEQESEDYWNSLTKDEQLKAFCAVSRRIRQGELIDKGTYRHVLYGVFGFGPEAYGAAQMAGYMEIHNSIVTGEDDDK